MFPSHLPRLILILFALAAIPLSARAQVVPAPAAPNLTPTLTREQILAAVDYERSIIQDLKVAFSFNATHSEPDDPVFRAHERAAAKGPMTRIERKESGHPAPGARTFTREVSYNGKFYVRHDAAERAVAFSTSKAPALLQECLLNDGFFQCALLNPPLDGTIQTDSQLQRLLKQPDARLRDKLEVINGNACYVLDVGNHKAPGFAMTIWLDPTRGFLPVQVFVFTEPTRTSMETYIDKAQEIIPGLWLPLHGRKVLNDKIIDNGNQLDFKPQPGISEYILEVDGWNGDHPSIEVNSGLKDEYFDLRTDLPTGTRLVDMDTRKSTIVGGKVDKTTNLAK